MTEDATQGNPTPQDPPKDPYEHINREAERLAKELSTIAGAQRLGDRAYERVQREHQTQKPC